MILVLVVSHKPGKRNHSVGQQPTDLHRGKRGILKVVCHQARVVGGMCCVETHLSVGRARYNRTWSESKHSTREQRTQTGAQHSCGNTKNTNTGTCPATSTSQTRSRGWEAMTLSSILVINQAGSHVENENWHAVLLLQKKKNINPISLIRKRGPA